MSLHENAKPSAAGYRDVAPSEVPSPAPAAVKLIDVREPAEFTGELGHIPGAQLVPMGTLAAVAASWPRDEEYLIICKAGGRSANSAQQLARMGFTKVMNLTGGMLAWNAAGLKVER
jgi:rhodanese-related sulfurtransferase